ncbi:MAG: thioredoxin domain-containing protein [archaeon]
MDEKEAAAKPDVKPEAKPGSKPAVKKDSERVENMVALGVFAFLILIAVFIFTQGFGLMKNSSPTDRVNVQLGNDPVRGNASDPIIIIAFSDYECPFCRKAEMTIRDIEQQYAGQVVLIFKDFPLTQIHKDALNAALAAECAREQGKYWEYHDYLFDHNDKLDIGSLELYALQFNMSAEKFNSCLESQKFKYEIDSDIKAATAAGVSSTPTFFINGIAVVGAQPEEEFTKIINSELSSSPR